MTFETVLPIVRQHSVVTTGGTLTQGYWGCLSSAYGMPQEDTRRPKLVTRDEAPSYMRRPYVSHGYLVGKAYRPYTQRGGCRCCESLIACINDWFLLALSGGSHLQALFCTLFGLSNETLNAWTMILGAVLATWMFLRAR